MAEKKEFTIRDARQTLAACIFAGLWAWYFKVGFFSIPWWVITPLCLVIVPIIVFASKGMAIFKFSPAAASSDAPSSPSSFAPPPILPDPPRPQKPEIPKLTEAPLEAARKLGMPAIFLQPHHPSLTAQDSTSWFGGFPIMPAHIEWPRENNAERRPMHFMAQVDCASLPEAAALANGFPRTGHLCFFAEIYELSETGAVVYFEGDISHMSPVLPPEDSVPIWGCDGYSNPFKGYGPQTDRGGLPHQSVMPRVPVQPIEFMSYPNFGHMFCDGQLFQRPDMEDEEIHALVDNLKALRNQELVRATGIDVQAAKAAWEALLMAPADPDHTGEKQYAGMVALYIQTMREDAKRFSGYDFMADKKLHFEKIVEVAQNFENHLKSLPTFQVLDATSVSHLRNLKQSWLALHTKWEVPPSSYKHKAWQTMRHVLFDDLVNNNHGPIPDDVKPALMWFQNPVHLPGFPKHPDSHALNARGIFQMGGFCNGSQYDPLPTAKDMPLLSVGYCELTGFAYGDTGDWMFLVHPEKLAQRDFTDVVAYAQCH